ncbi:putative membrane protein YdjX (TVP38/TMEM64 family) [Paenibacillus cellulosilyticus]|uniref:TVP38/TMEM64 family membrane protein n=1 Tax=Paenibacillus cellulosilyticus TaxID=375489 RepID=A0A2V2YZL2_9BACL|nr:TVP38/TMEM64 family protein [Paenibacillus cellulosilyticus]PWW08559.1 putative membrane protein YdjX (TVP38/TMEM64 family) [Paenibacillus cellulosilyticus]QKS48875.1 TVP38/TMEM64 family protein [Paenibacillus cellulosilyticus]
MSMSDWIAYWTDKDHLLDLLEQYRSLGPLPGVALTFMKSFVPPLPTLVIVGVNAAVYGLWLGFLYSWIGLVAGCLTTFLLVRRIADHPFLKRYAQRKKVQNGLRWVRRNAFSYVFILSIFPVGPFVVVNVAAALAGMRFRSFLLAVAAGKGIMVLAVSIVGHDVGRYYRNPELLIYIVLLIGLSLVVMKRLEAKYMRHTEETVVELTGEAEAK